MKIRKYLRASTEDYILLSKGEQTFVYFTSKRKCYVGKTEEFEENHTWQVEYTYHEYRYAFIIFIITAACIAWSLHLYISSNLNSYRYLSSYPHLLSLLFYALFQALIHEYSHVLALRLHGQKIDSWGFHFNLGFIPSIFVRINRVYLLPPGFRITVHLAGVFANAVSNTTFLISSYHCTQLSASAPIFLIFNFAILFNIIPFVNSDGYRALLTLLNLDTSTLKHTNSSNLYSRIYYALKVGTVLFFLISIATIVISIVGGRAIC